MFIGQERDKLSNNFPSEEVTKREIMWEGEIRDMYGKQLVLRK